MYVSSLGADAKSKGFYLKLKGEIDAAVAAVNLPSTSVFRPSLLLGNRKENRPGERIAQLLMPLFSFLMPLNYKPISGETVASALLNASKSKSKTYSILQYQEIMDAANS